MHSLTLNHHLADRAPLAVKAAAIAVSAALFLLVALPVLDLGVRIVA
jgi:hypothetical protein